MFLFSLETWGFWADLGHTRGNDGLERVSSFNGKGGLTGFGTIERFGELAGAFEGEGDEGGGFTG